MARRRYVSFLILFVMFVTSIPTGGFGLPPVAASGSLTSFSHAVAEETAPSFSAEPEPTAEAAVQVTNADTATQPPIQRQLMPSDMLDSGESAVLLSDTTPESGTAEPTAESAATQPSATPSPLPTTTLAESPVPTPAPTPTIATVETATPTVVLTTAPAFPTVATASPVPTAAPVLYGEPDEYTFSIQADPAARSMELTVQLEKQVGVDQWDAVPNPLAPEEIYSLTLTLNSKGFASGALSLAGLPVQALYRMRVSTYQLPPALVGASVNITFEDASPTDVIHATVAAVALQSDTPTATITPAPTAEPLPSATPVPVFAEGASIPVDAVFSFIPETGYGELVFGLLMDAGAGEVLQSTLTLTPDAAGNAAGALTLAGLPTESRYRAVLLSYAGTPLTFVWDDAAACMIADTDALRFTANDGVGALHVQVKMPVLPSLLLAEPFQVEAASYAALSGASSADDPYTTPFEFTLNMAHNGLDPIAFPIAFTLHEDSDTNALQVTIDAYDSSLASVAGSVSGDAIALSIRPVMTDGLSLVYHLQVDIATQAYTLSISSLGYQTSSANESGTFEAGQASADVTAMALVNFVANVTWNDGKATARPTPSLTLMADGAPIADAPTPVYASANYSLDTYTYPNLPKYAAGVIIPYAVTQADVPGYLTAQSSPNIVNTLKTSLTAYVQWQDASTAAETRPNSTTFSALLTLAQHARRAGAPIVALSGPAIALDSTANPWVLHVADLPAYDPDGYPYDYMFSQAHVDAANQGYGTYVNTVRNVGVYNGQIAAGIAYQGGTLINTITDSIGFRFTKQWLDGSAATRPQVRFYLYRFPKNTGLGYNTLSPVTGHDNVTLTATGDTQVVEYAADGTLPRYDLYGNEYVYYLRETMTNQGDYQIKIQNTDPSVKDFILPNAVVTNVREATISIPYSKFWRAKAVQSMNGGIAVALSRKLVTDGDEAWADIATQTLTGFRTETMTLSSAFAGMDKYDPNGVAYAYRVREIGATLNAVDGIVPTDNVTDNAFSENGYAFQVLQPTDGNNLIINALVGTTSLRVIKTWSPALPEGTESGITIKLFQNGTDTWDAGSVTYPSGVTHNGGVSYTLTGQGTLDVLFDHLPKYDADGRAYAYTVTETAVITPSDYHLNNINYSVGGDGIQRANISNVKGGEGSSLVFRINKVWKDDGDALARVPVTFGLFYVGGETPMQVASRTLSAADSWTGLLGYTPGAGESGVASDYVIREITGGSLTVNADSAYLTSGSGSARTASQRYTVSTVKSGNTYTITNLRVGHVVIQVSKTWRMTALADQAYVATFTLYRDGSTPIDTKTVRMEDTDPILFGQAPQLDKYDAEGVIIPYSVRETSLTSLSGDTLYFSGGAVTVAPDEYVLSSAQSGVYQVGATPDDPDTMAYTFRNTLSGAGTLGINVVWRDDGSGEPRRPDIRVSLYRSITDAQGASELLATLRLWDTDISGNDFYWTCNFGNYPRFDDAGNRYDYYVKPFTLQSSQYRVSYFSSAEGVTAQPDASATDTQGTFPIQAGESSAVDFAYANFDNALTGTIILTLSDMLDVQRTKVWENLPGWFKQTYLPTVRFQLFRSLAPITEATVGEAVQKDGADWVESLVNHTTARFEGAPVYNEYGQRYFYYVMERDTSGAPFDVDWYATVNDPSSGTVTNTYRDSGPAVAIQITKEWLYPAETLTEGQLNYPAAWFELHRYWQSSDGLDVQDVLLNTVKIPSGSIASLTVSGMPSLLVTQDSAGKTLLRYAPDGTEYLYYVTEKPITGYQTDPASLRMDVTTWNPEHTQGEVTFQNTYTPGMKAAPIIATKYWNDAGNLYRTRPVFDTDAMPISFALWRKPAGGEGAPVPASLIAAHVWTEGSDSHSNEWYCTFTGTFPTYSSLGEAYTYYVVETLDAAYVPSYKPDRATENTLFLKNNLVTLNVNLTKSWRDNNGTLLDQAALDSLRDLGTMPDAALFTVSQTDDLTPAWTQTLEPFSKRVTWQDLLANALNGRYLVMITGVPKYVPGTDTPYQYQVTETGLEYGGITKPPLEYGFAVSSENPASNTTAIENRIEVRKLYFAKDWLDDNNRDGARPANIQLIVQSSAGKVTDVTLSPSTTSSDPHTDPSLFPERVAKANRWRSEITVPVSGTYTVTEVTPAPSSGYLEASGSPCILQNESSITDFWGFSNERALDRIAVSADKIWVGDETYAAITRPASVTFQLLARVQGEEDWINLADAASVSDPELPTGTQAAVTLTPIGDDWHSTDAIWQSWRALPAHAYKATSGATTMPMEYSVMEVPENGYATAYTPALVAGDTAAAAPAANTIVCSNTLITISLQGTKHWVDENNKHGRRPEAITLTVYADGVALDPQPIPVWGNTGTSDWSYTFTDLPRYRKGTLTHVNYTVAESIPADYLADASLVSGTRNATTGNVTAADFTNRLATITIAGTKTWLDATDRYRMRPSDITLTVKNGSSTLSPQPTVAWTKPNGSNQWTYSFSGVPRYEKGTTTPINYTVTETPTGGYALTTDATVGGTVDAATGNVSAANFTNELITISLSGSKVWSDYNDYYAMRPTSLTLSVKENGTALNPQPTLVWDKTANPWVYSATGLPKYRKGSSTPATYSVTESAVAGYTTTPSATISATLDGSGNALVAAFTNTLRTVTLQGSKTWSDQNNLYHRRPEALTLTLRADGAPIIPLTAVVWNQTANPWTYSFTGLPRYRKGTGTPIVYSVLETAAAGYNAASLTATGTVNGTTGNVSAVNLTNTLATVSVSGQKTWVDQHNRYGTRPASITLRLLADGLALDPQPTPVWDLESTPDVWTYTFAAVPKYRTDNVTPIVYTVEETPSATYSAADSTPASGSVDAGGNVTGANFTNTLQTISLQGSKTWVDQRNYHHYRPADITLTVLADGVPMATAPEILWSKPAGFDVWTYSIPGLPRYQKGVETPITYTVRESAVPGYLPDTATDSTGTVDATTGNVAAANFTNTLPTVTLNGIKRWADYHDYYATRPDSVTLTVLANGAALAVQPAIQWNKTGDAWSYAIDGLPKFLKGSYDPAVYTVAETVPLGYVLADAAPVTGSVDSEGNITQADFQNHLQTIDLSGQKTWIDQSDTFGRRPETLQLTLLANGEPLVPEGAISWSQSGDVWQYSIQNLPRYRAGTDAAIVYQVQEGPVAGYSAASTTATGEVDSTTGYVSAADFENSLSVINFTGTKTWVDQDDAYHTRPAQIDLQLYADNALLNPQPEPVWQPTADANVWAFTYSALPRYRTDGITPIVYYIAEAVPTGYLADAATAYGTVGADGHVVDAALTNRLATISVQGEKVWVDDSDRYGMRPANLNLAVLADGAVMADQPTVQWSRAGNVWSFQIVGLPRYNASTGEPTSYTFQEMIPDGYQASDAGAISGTQDIATGDLRDIRFTNTLQTITLQGHKYWMDQGDRYRLRPSELTLTVLANDEPMNPQPEVLWDKSVSPWTYTIQGLPRYNKGSATPTVYLVSETPVAGYVPTVGESLGTVTDSGDITDADLTNTLYAITLSGHVFWVDQSNLYRTRPETVSLTVMADGAPMSPQPDIQWNHTGDAWSYAVPNLPRYQLGSVIPVTYSVLETAVPGYTPLGDTSVVGVPGTDHNITDVDFTHTLVTVALEGLKNWDDYSNRYNLRPDHLTLTVLADGVALTPQPTAVWDMPLGADRWTFQFSGLPRYQVGTNTPVLYTLRESPVSGYQPTADQSGTVDAATGDITAITLDNRLTIALEIDNMTTNLVTSQTNAGGFVALGNASPTMRDRDPYQQRAATVTWMPENNWRVTEQFTVAFLPHGADSARGWQSVTVHYGNIDALRAIPAFSNATLTQASGVYCLTLSDTPESLPCLTRVLVTFTPTLAVENLTDNHAGGLVFIHSPNAVIDGRYVATIAYAQTQDGYQVDMNQLQLYVPAQSLDAAALVQSPIWASWLAAAQADSVTPATAKIMPDQAGRFATSLTADVGGVTTSVPITGVVRVLDLDRHANPSRVSITLDSMPLSLNVGVRFIASTAIPETGDPLLWVLGLFALSGMMLFMLKRKKQRS
ncbi:MAG: Cna B-type domain-containing protein [Candidatus Limiplasma sp.]|nr:Cna B-type domain-containing protein [Candidatus Limiplasma sp.]